MLTTYKSRKNTLLWLSTETNCDCAIWSKTAIWNARREGETYGCGPVRPVSPPGPAKDAVCIGRTVQKTANSTTANRSLLDTLFLSTAVHGLVHCPLTRCRHAAVGDVAARRFNSRRRPTETTQNSLSCERRRKKKAVLGSAKKAKLDHAPAQPANGLPFLVLWPWPGHARCWRPCWRDEPSLCILSVWHRVIDFCQVRRKLGGEAASRRRLPSNSVAASTAHNRKKMHDARF